MINIEIIQKSNMHNAANCERNLTKKVYITSVWSTTIQGLLE